MSSSEAIKSMMRGEENCVRLFEYACFLKITLKTCTLSVHHKLTPTRTKRNSGSERSKPMNTFISSHHAQGLTNNTSVALRGLTPIISSDLVNRDTQGSRELAKHSLSLVTLVASQE